MIWKIEEESEGNFSSKNGKITCSSSPYDNQGRMAAQHVIQMTPGPTRYSVSHVEDISATFHLFITPAIEKNHPGGDKFGGL